MIFCWIGILICLLKFLHLITNIAYKCSAFCKNELLAIFLFHILQPTISSQNFNVFLKRRNIYLIYILMNYTYSAYYYETLPKLAPYVSY